RLPAGKVVQHQAAVADEAGGRAGGGDDQPLACGRKGLLLRLQDAWLHRVTIHAGRPGEFPRLALPYKEVRLGIAGNPGKDSQVARCISTGEAGDEVWQEFTAVAVTVRPGLLRHGRQQVAGV